MARILRGDVIWASLEPVVGHEQGGQRPVLVLSGEEFNRRSGTVIAMAITSRPQRAGFPLTLPIDGLPKSSWLKISQIRNLSVERMGERITRLSGQVLADAVDGLLELVDPDPRPAAGSRQPIR